jgi:uncharacterized membrane protein
MQQEDNLLADGDFHTINVKIIDDTPAASCCSSTSNDNEDDPDAVIPERFTTPLVVSSHLLLVTAIVALYFQFWILFAVNIFVYLTSVCHWRRPRFSTIERKLDYIAVAANIIYGTVFSLSLKTPLYKVVWFLGLLLIGVIFAINETLFYWQTMRSPLGEELELDSETAQCAEVTKPNTPERYDSTVPRNCSLCVLCKRIVSFF